MDGQLKERGAPDEYHSYLQGWFLIYFESRKSELGLRGLAELRLRVSARAFRLPDVLVVPVSAKFLPKLTETPLLCIEILSPDDRRGDLDDKLEDYAELGVPVTWIVDPRRKSMSVCDGSGCREVEELTLPGRPVVITKAELSAKLDGLEYGADVR